MSQLNPRQQEIAAMIAQGFDNQQIAWRLGISLGRVKNIITAILAKTGAVDRIHLGRMWKEKTA